MPFAEFQPGNAGLALSDFSLRSQDAYASLMDRAQRRKLAEQEFDLRKQEFANNLATSALQQDSLRAEIGIRRAQLSETERKARDLAVLRDEYNGVSGEISRSLGEIERQRDPFQQRRLLNQIQSQAARFYRDPELRTVLEKQFSAIHDTVAANESVNLSQAVARLSIAHDEDSLAETIRDPAVGAMLGVPGSKVADLYRAQRAALTKERQTDDQTGVRDLAARAKVDTDTRERSVPGFDGLAPTKEEAVKFRDLASNNLQILDGVAEIARLSAQQGATTDLKVRARIETLQAFLVGKLRLPMTGPGAFTDSEREFVRNTIGNPARILSLGDIERSKLEELTKRLNADIDTTAAGIGLKRASKEKAPVNGTRAQALARGAKP
ncbi:MAG: hypothetical protein ACKODK_13745 [Opitutaceae bacterium]